MRSSTVYMIRLSTALSAEMIKIYFSLQLLLKSSPTDSNCIDTRPERCYD